MPLTQNLDLHRVCGCARPCLPVVRWLSVGLADICIGISGPALVQEDELIFEGNEIELVSNSASHSD